ncbi:hypothetical protein CVO96_19895 [Deinococcus koreensis]|uniref:Uncharacterized protein n=1 Tax=Deinococcus koreensis TaxID=2054903 RepID=A0A2K3US64_9DEIO|nr:hypothetical protein CVO96_19895 [Deinococcus koreensis]
MYAVLDCVYSSQTCYASVVLPLLYERFPAKSGLADTPALTFSAFPHPERLEDYAIQVMGTRHKISGRLKVEVAWDVCQFFVTRHLESRIRAVSTTDTFA